MCQCARHLRSHALGCRAAAPFPTRRTGGVGVVLTEPAAPAELHAHARRRTTANLAHPGPGPHLPPQGVHAPSPGVRRRGAVPEPEAGPVAAARGAGWDRATTGRCGAGCAAPAAPPSAAGRAALRLATECHRQWPPMLAPPGPCRCRRLRSDATRHSGGSRAPQHGERAFQRCDVPPIPLDPTLPPSVSNGRP